MINADIVKRDCMISRGQKMYKKLIYIIAVIILIAGCSTEKLTTDDIKDSVGNFSSVKNVTKVNPINQTIHKILPQCVGACKNITFNYNQTDCKRYCYSTDDYCFCNKTGLRG